MTPRDIQAPRFEPAFSSLVWDFRNYLSCFALTPDPSPRGRGEKTGIPTGGEGEERGEGRLRPATWRAGTRIASRSSSSDSGVGVPTMAGSHREGRG